MILNLSFIPSPFGEKALGTAKGIDVPVISANAVAVVDATSRGIIDCYNVRGNKTRT